MKWTKIFHVVACAALLAGCAVQRQNQRIPDSTFQKPAKVVILELSGFETACFVKEGDQGLLDSIINECMTSGVGPQLAKFNAKMHTDKHYIEAFKDSFKRKGFEVIVSHDKHMQDKLIPVGKEDALHPKFDFSFIRHQYKADYALVLQPHVYRVFRTYYGFIPTSSPKAHVGYAVYLVNLSSNTLVGYHEVNVIEEPKTNWDEPPYYNSLIDSVRDGLINGLKDSHKFLIG